MSYLRGCLIMLAVLAGSYFFEVRQLETLALPFLNWLAAALAVVVALLAGSVDELIAMYFRRGQPVKLVENELVAVSGQLRPVGSLVVSPVSGRQVLMYEYVWRESGLPTGEYRGPVSIIRGVAMAPCELVTSQGAIRVEGFANLEHFKEDTLDARRATNGMEERLQRKQWKPVGNNVMEAMKALDTPMGLEGGSIDFLNPSAEQSVGQGGLSNYLWVLTERVVVPGSEVTAKGVYRSGPARVHVGREGLNVTNELRPGSAAVVSGQNLAKQWIGVAAFAGIAVLSHVFVYMWLGTILQMNSD